MIYENIERVTLSGGLRVLLHPDDRSRSASVSVFIGSGSRFETGADAGVSHFIEHMLFKGTEKRSALDIAAETDAIGGQLNAYTTKEYTCVYVRALDEHLARAIDIMTDMITSSKFAENDIELERGVILEELGMYDDSPEDLVLDGLYAAVWPDNMLGANILGTAENITGMTAGTMRSHISRQYAANRVVVAVSGAFDRGDVLARLEKGLASLPRDGAPFEAEKAEYHNAVSVIEKPFEQIQLCLGFPAVALDDPRRNTLGILNGICGGASSSRLFQRIREELGLAYSVGSSSTQYMREGLFEIDAAVSVKNQDAALTELVRELCRLRRDGVTAEELDRVREQAKASVIMGLEGNSAISSYMGRCELMQGFLRSEDELLAAINGVTLEQVNEAARTFIDFDRLSLCAVGKISSEEHYLGVVHSAIY